MKYTLFQAIYNLAAQDAVELQLLGHDLAVELQLLGHDLAVPQQGDKVRIAGIAGYILVKVRLFFPSSTRIEILLEEITVTEDRYEAVLAAYLGNGWTHAERMDAPSGL